MVNITSQNKHTPKVFYFTHVFFLIWPEMLVLVVFLFNTNNPFYKFNLALLLSSNKYMSILGVLSSNKQ